MDKEPTQQTLDEQLDLISEQLETEMKRFSNIEALGRAVYLSEAEKQLKDLQDVRTKFLGKKSEFASLKKSIGRVAAEDRPSFGQLRSRITSKPPAPNGTASMSRFPDGVRGPDICTR